MAWLLILLSCLFLASGHGTLGRNCKSAIQQTLELGASLVRRSEEDNEMLAAEQTEQHATSITENFLAGAGTDLDIKPTAALSLLQLQKHKQDRTKIKRKPKKKKAPWSDMTKIEFEPNKRPERILTYNGLFDQTKRRSRVLARPHWVKTLRCADESSGSCSGCATKDWFRWRPKDGGLNCWTRCFGEEGPSTSWRHGSNGSPRCLLAKDRQWKRHVTHIHLRCVHGRVEMSMQVQRLSAGVLRLFWDGREVTGKDPDTKGDLDFPLNTSQIGDFRWAKKRDRKSLRMVDPIARGKRSRRTAQRFDARLFAHGADGGHVFTIEFTPDHQTRKNSLVQISRLAFWMQNEYTQCLDSKACFDELRKHGEYGERLRNSNRLQSACLQLPSTKLTDFVSGRTCDDSSDHACAGERACAAWRECLDHTGEGTRENLLQLLRASGVDLLAPRENVLDWWILQWSEQQAGAAEQRAASNDVPHCTYPPSEDPESWDCDCHEGMKKQCKQIAALPGSANYSEDMCMRAQICASDRVCKSWKEQQCGNPALRDLQQKLTSVALWQRRVVASSGRKTLDQSTGTKSCV